MNELFIIPALILMVGAVINMALQQTEFAIVCAIMFVGCAILSKGASQ